MFGALSGTHHALDDAPERAPLDVLGDEVEPLVFIEHPDELEHIGVLEASHDLHLVGSKETRPGTLPVSPPSAVPPEATDSPKDGAASMPCGPRCVVGLSFLPPWQILFFQYVALVSHPLPLTLNGGGCGDQNMSQKTGEEDVAVLLTDLLEKCPLCLLVEPNQLLHHHHLARLPVCHLHVTRRHENGVRSKPGLQEAPSPP